MQGPAAPGAQGLLLSARGDAGKVQAVFDSLQPVDGAQLEGFWQGEEVPSGHPLDGLLSGLAWAGKRFDANDAVHPLVFERGGRRFAVNPWLPAKMLPVVLRWPAVTKSRGVLALARVALRLLQTRRSRARVRSRARTVAIVYDDVGIVDVLKLVEEGVLLGRMEKQGMRQPYFFLLRRARS